LIDCAVLKQLKRGRRAQVFVGRCPVWLDLPFEEESVWVSLPLPAVEEWATGRNDDVQRLMRIAPEVAECVQIAGSHAWLKVTLPVRCVSKSSLNAAIGQILSLASRWREWLMADPEFSKEMPDLR
jgi:hypothetical protein